MSLAAAALSAPAAAVSRGVRRRDPRYHAVPAPGRPRTCRRQRTAAGDRRKVLRARASHRTRRGAGDHRCAACHQPDPDDLCAARRPGARRTAHLSRRAVVDHHRGRAARSRGDDRRRLGTRRAAGRGPPTVAEPGLPDPRQPESHRADDARRGPKAVGGHHRRDAGPAPSSTRRFSTCGWTNRYPRRWPRR